MDDSADVDTHAFLQSVRELKEKRQREDNERQEQLEAQIATSRLARKLERERSMASSSSSTSPPPPASSRSASPHKASPSSAVPSRASTLSRRPLSVDLGSPVRPMSVDTGSPSRVDMGSPTRAASVRPMSMMSIPEQGSPLPTRDLQRFAPPDTTTDAALGRTMSSAQSRLERPSSPTKGMGGFVQSAMLKRNDSVNKRWSVTPGPATLSRNDSTATFRSDAHSRPASSHSTSNLNLNLNTTPARDVDSNQDKTERRHSRSRSVASASGQDATPDAIMSPPLSPNKRWSRSPTKASWLESALARPDSPKPLASPQASQPSWMTDLAKAKQQRSTQDNIDAAKVQDTPNFGQGLLKRSSIMRNTPTHSPSASRNLTPPAKAKPVTLASRPAVTEPSTPSTPKEPEQTKPVKQEPASTSSPASTLPFKSQTIDHLDSPRLPASKTPELKSTEFQSPESKQNTTPKTDFRSGLKSRSGTIGAATREEPEFKALFGKLKKAQTDKYVAPDELKDNILRGKAGLSLTGGPQKSERRDELKESLLKKKEEMVKAALEKPVSEKKPSSAPTHVPEAISIRKQLGRSNSSLNLPAPTKSHRDITPEALSLHKSIRGKPKAPVPEKRNSMTDGVESKRDSVEATPSANVLDKEPTQNEPVLPNDKGHVKQELPKPETREPPKPAKQELPKPTQQEPSKPQVQVKPISNKIADRFNPALAGLLARGPPSASNTPPSGSAFSPPALGVTHNRQAQGPDEGTQLTHMTKSRAKGPKRRKPKSSAPIEPVKVSSQSSAPTETANAAPKPSALTEATNTTRSEKRFSSIQSAKTEETPLSSPVTKTPLQPRPKSAAVRAVSISLSKPTGGEAGKPQSHTPTKSMTFPSVQSDKPTTHVSARSSLEAMAVVGLERSKPVTPAKPSVNTPPSKTIEKMTVSNAKPLPFRSSSSGSPLNMQPTSSVVSQSAVRKPSDFSRPLPSKPLPSLQKDVSPSQNKPLPPLKTAEADKENQGFSSVRGAASMWGKSSQQTTPQKLTPIELPTRKDEEAAMLSAGLLSNSSLRQAASPKQGLGISEDGINQIKGREQTPPSSAGFPPKPAKSSRVVSGQLSAKDLPHLPNVPDLPAGRQLNGFFGELPKSHGQLQLNTDTQTVLRSRSGESDKIRTLRASIQEIKSDGTLITLPAQQDHILYEDSMYICTHVFYTANMTRMAEVYLWCGDGISESTIQDTQVHAKRLAREAGEGQKSTQLYIIDQAREPANFFQALGGIVITRRGSRADSSSTPYMLCGRPHMGHIAFDEVDRSKSSLCSEYPYIIARPITLQETKIWLWKGSGCGATAIGSTRLISMDLNPGGGFTEIEEGKETAEFLAAIHDVGAESVCQSPPLWIGKSGSWEHSCLRLFRIEVREKPKQTTASFFSSYFSRRPSGSAPKPPSPDTAVTFAHNAEFDASISEIAPFTQDDLEPEGCYILDAHSEIIVLPGPLLGKQPLWQHAFVQACLFSHDYSILSASLEDRPAIPKAKVVLGGLPRDVRIKFRRWDERRGLWGSGGLMAGKATTDKEDEGSVDVRDVLGVCCGL